jgi:hypothetical protein
MNCRQCILIVAPLWLGCVDVDVIDVTAADEQPATITTMTGPNQNASVDLSLADVWIVPPLPDNGNIPLAWTLTHPVESVTAIIRRTCTAQPETFLWLSDPPNWKGSSALATLHSCGVPGEFYATVEVLYDGTQWIGVSATGAASILPP